MDLKLHLLYQKTKTFSARWLGLRTFCKVRWGNSGKIEEVHQEQAILLTSNCFRGINTTKHYVSEVYKSVLCQNVEIIIVQ